MYCAVQDVQKTQNHSKWCLIGTEVWNNTVILLNPLLHHRPESSWTILLSLSTLYYNIVLSLLEQYCYPSQSSITSVLSPLEQYCYPSQPSFTSVPSPLEQCCYPSQPSITSQSRVLLNNTVIPLNPLSHLSHLSRVLLNNAVIHLNPLLHQSPESSDI